MGLIYATGSRKKAVARVYLDPTINKEDSILINRKPLTTYFPIQTHSQRVKQPLDLLETPLAQGISIFVKGGGKAGQVDATRHAIARLLVAFDETNKPLMKGAKFLTRDSRMKERKKFGLRKARKRKQWTKR